MAFTVLNTNLATGSTEVLGNITSATKWTTARTITVGNTGKLVDGSSNVSYSLDEIGIYSKAAIDSKINNIPVDILKPSIPGYVSGVTYTNSKNRIILVGAYSKSIRPRDGMVIFINNVRVVCETSTKMNVATTYVYVPPKETFRFDMHRDYVVAVI